MKAIRMILAVMMAVVMMASCANSQKVVSANEAKKLNKNQQCLLDHTNELLQTCDNKILLPTELNVLFGDSANTQNIEAQPMWDKAHFVSEKDVNVLVVPMKSNHTGVGTSSMLIVEKKDAKYYEIISTYLECNMGNATEYIQIESNINGKFNSAKVYDENNNVIATYGINYYTVPEENRGKNNSNNNSPSIFLDKTELVQASRISSTKGFLNTRNDLNFPKSYGLRNWDNAGEHHNEIKKKQK